MNNRELLELAAKAAGVSYCGSGVVTVEDRGVWVGDYADDSKRYWNPLTDFGTALQLGMKLEFRIEPRAVPGAVYIDRLHPHTCRWHHYAHEFYNNENMMTAVCRAITRAAAEVGKAMP